MIVGNVVGGEELEEKISSGGKQFAFVLVWMAVLYVACGTFMAAMGDYAWIGGVVAILVFCVFGFFVLTHYTALFTYSIKNGRLRINRKIGKRNKEVEFACGDIVRTSYGVKPPNFPKHSQSMRISVFSGGRSLYIEYKDKDGALCGVVTEPSEKFRRRIDRDIRERKKTDND